MNGALRPPLATVDRVEDYLAHNRANWDERTGIHLRSRFYDVEGWLREGRGPRRREVEALGDVSGLRLLHLQCHFGLDTLAWARVGAHVTGLDFSPTAIDAARALARRAGLAERSEFVCADVYDAVEALGRRTFDVVYVSLGALSWLPSVDRWAEQVGALVARGGRLYLHDVHPLAWALADDGSTIAYSYFEEAEPFVDDSEESYTDADRPIVNRRSYEWNHGIAETVTALIGHGLRLEWLVEHDRTVRQRFPWLVADGDGRWTTPPGHPRLPLTFSLLAGRPAADG
jgi:SAM-dependent methyltransferase